MTRICIVAGGTGGHIIPALAFAEWVLSKEQHVTLSFVSGSRPLEREIYSSRGFFSKILPLSGSPFGASGFLPKVQRWRETFLAFSLFRSFLKEENFDCCILFGGYTSFVPLLVCRMKGIPVIIHEQNCVAGKVTRLAVTMKAVIATGWDVCTPLSPGTFVKTGIPIRLFQEKVPMEAWKRIQPGKPFPQNKIIGVLGGSLMSERLIQLLSCVVEDEELKHHTYLLLGEPRKNAGKIGLFPHSSNVVFIEKQWDMSDFFSIIDGAVARGGASTLSELMAWNIPSVIIPWKNAADNHQEKNALYFAEHAFGELWREDEPLGDLKVKILSILRNERKRAKGFSEGDESESLWRLISSSIGREIN